MEDRSFDFVSGEVLLVDKPLNWTSFQVVNKLRWEIKHKLGLKKIKVGHAGTLDPLATGLLVLCTGKKTKEIEGFLSADKVYTGTITVGSTTPSYDLETEIDEEFDTTHVDEILIESARQQFLGSFDQMPPIFSAKKVDGKRAYESARAGKEVKLKARKVHIEQFDLDTSRFPLIDFKVHCTKGTYIRSLAHDFGKALNSGAHLSALRREASGQFKIEDAFTLDKWIEIIQNS